MTYPAAVPLSVKEWNQVLQEGAIARMAGQTLLDCPFYTNPEMSVAWRVGWQQMDDHLRQGKLGPGKK